MFNSITDLLYILPGLLLGLSLHEYLHAFVAYKCGDETQKSLGRITLNPMKHIDPMGFLFILMFGFGWAKPVQLNGRNLKKPKRDFFLISIAGPLANLVLAFFMALILAGFDCALNLNRELSSNSLFVAASSVFGAAVLINLLLFIFNSLPLPGFDGYHAITAFLPARINEKLYPLERFGFLILMIFIIFDTPLTFMYNIMYFLLDKFMFLWEAVIMFILNLFLK